MTYSLQFTERMTGAFSFAEPDYQAGYEAGRLAGNQLLFRLTIATGCESTVSDAVKNRPATSAMSSARKQSEVAAYDDAHG